MEETVDDLLRIAEREEREVERDEAWFVGLRNRRREVAGTSPGKRRLHQVMRLVPKLPGLRPYAARIAPRRLRLECPTIPIPGLPAGLDGLRIGFLTDIHHDRGRPLAILERGVELLNDAAPDVIILGGDYVVGRSRGFAPCARLLGRLRAPLGVFGILGNHDHWGSAGVIAAHLGAVGVVMLRNAARRLLAPGGAPCWLVGLDTAMRGRADLDAALAAVPEGEFRLLLAHEPDVADAIGARGVRVGLQLSGHTHGGQIVVPGLGPLILPPLGQRYVRGLFHTPAGPLYVSRGLGGVPPFLRFNAPPEVTLLTLAPEGRS